MFPATLPNLLHTYQLSARESVCFNPSQDTYIAVNMKALSHPNLHVRDETMANRQTMPTAEPDSTNVDTGTTTQTTIGISRTPVEIQTNTRWLAGINCTAFKDPRAKHSDAIIAFRYR